MSIIVNVSCYWNTWRIWFTAPAYIKARLHMENNIWSPLYTGAALSREQKYVSDCTGMWFANSLVSSDS